MSFELNIKSLVLRPFSNKDLDVLCNIYCSTRIAEMDMMSSWTVLQKENFLRMQFNAQHHHYMQHYKDAHFWLIEKNGKPVGRLYLDEKFEDGSIRIIDITLLPKWRNKGIGKSILLEILGYAKRHKQPVTLHVEVSNEAMRLYKRLGFKQLDLNNFRYLMRWDDEKS